MSGLVHVFAGRRSWRDSHCGFRPAQTGMKMRMLSPASTSQGIVRGPRRRSSPRSPDRRDTLVPCSSWAGGGRWWVVLQRTLRVLTADPWEPLRCTVGDASPTTQGTLQSQAPYTRRTQQGLSSRARGSPSVQGGHVCELPSPKPQETSCSSQGEQTAQWLPGRVCRPEPQRDGV